MRVAIDATPAAVQIAGVGRYTRELLRALLQLSVDDSYALFCASGDAQARQMLQDLPPGAWRELHRIPLPERVTTGLWHRLGIPLPVDTLIRDFDVFHGPDFVVPPTRRPSVVTIHDVSYLVAPQYAEPSLVAYLTSAVPKALQQASQVITVSASVAAELVEAYPFVEGRVRAIPNGVRTRVRSSSTTPLDGQPTVLTVGTIEPRKNLPALLRAMRQVWITIPDARLVVAGRIGWQADEIMAQLRVACDTSRVEFVNAPDDRQLEVLYAQAHVFAFPSFHEGFGLPILEAMNYNVPVVSSDIRVLRETGGSAARYVAPQDAEALGIEILNVLHNQELRTEMANAGRKRVDRYSWEETARLTSLAYHTAIDEGVR